MTVFAWALLVLIVIDTIGSLIKMVSNEKLEDRVTKLVSVIINIIMALFFYMYLFR